MIALIPARGGSKRVPRKNVLPFHGHPMLAYTIAAARNAGLFTLVVVSTDDGAIAEVAEAYGAQVLWRPSSLADDRATLVDVGLHALKALPAEGRAFCQLMPNCPLRRSEDVRAHWQAFESARRLFQISAVPFRGVYPQWSLLVEEDGRGSWAFGERLTVSQELAPMLCPTGAVWWADREAFLAQRRYYGTPFHVMPMDADRGIDVDTAEDLRLADLLVRGLRDRDGASPLEPIVARVAAAAARELA